MEPTLRQVSEHMRRLGLGALQHANWHSNYMSWENDQWSQLSVLQAAHAAEILIKARIAEEHPLLIFERLPNPAPDEGDLLSLRQLVERARTVQFFDLPQLLWATTGMRLPNVEDYLAFGRLRNTIQHFVAPEGTDFSWETAKFIYKVIDPFINNCWELFAVDFNEDHEPYVYLIEGLVRKGVMFLISPDAVPALKQADFEWPETDPAYKQEMEQRFADAQKAVGERAADHAS